MKRLVFLFVIFNLTQVSAQKNLAPYYVTNNDDTLAVKKILAFDFVPLQDEVRMINIREDTLTFHPQDIKAFAFELIKTKRFQSVTLNGQRKFLRILVDGTNLKFGYSYRKYFSSSSFIRYNVNYVLCHSGDCTGFSANYNWTNGVADYPLLSNILSEKKFWTENESVLFYRKGFKFIVKEYNEWNENKKKGLVTDNDTSMALRGVLDANKYFNKRINFIFNFFVNGLFTPLVGGPVAFISGGKDPIFLKIPNKELRKNHEYMSGYKARAYQLKSKAALRGHLWGYTLFAAILAVRIVTGN